MKEKLNSAGKMQPYDEKGRFASKTTPNIINADYTSNQNNKLKQLEIINKTNPMLDDYHTGIRKVEDIKTWDEVLELDDDREGQFAWGDFSREDAEEVARTRKVKVYSSKPLKDGNFISTSYAQAQEYAGSGRIYEAEMDVKDIAWINGDEGQIAKVKTKVKANVIS